MNPEGMVALLNYREDGTTRKFHPRFVSASMWSNNFLKAYFTFWKDGVKEVKL